MPWYLYFKIFHLVGMVSWMAGLFYLPRLFVYHAEARDLPEATRGPVQQQLTVMMGRLLNIIMTPAMVMTFIGGTAHAREQSRPAAAAVDAREAHIGARTRWLSWLVLGDAQEARAR